MSKKFIDLANLKSNLENFLSEIISPTFATKEGVSNQLGNHTVKSDVPENAVFTDTVYDDTEVQKRISDNGYGEVAGGKNLANPKNFVNNKVVDVSSGGILNNDSYFISGYIEVSPNITYTKQGFTSTSEHYFYDKDKNPIKGFMAETFIPPENAKYVVLSGIMGNQEIAQLEEGSVATEYEPYFPSNKMLAEEKADKSETTVNLLKPKLQTTTNNGITCTYNGDGTYTLNGTAISTAYFRIQGITALAQRTTNKTYKLVGCPTGGTNKYDLRYEINGSIANGGGKDFGDGVIIKNDKINSTNITSAEIIIAVMKDIIVNNLVFKPMLTTNLDATYDDFVPYTGDSGSLNGDVAQINESLGNYALKSLYGDTTINVGRLAGSAVGIRSTAEGDNTIASGYSSHAEGQGTIAAGKEQHVEGKYNVKDTENKYAHIIGGGTSSTKRRNIHTVDWNGNAYYAGDVTTASKSLNKAPQLIYTLKTGNTTASETIDVTNNYGPTHQYLYTINAFGNDGYEVGLVMYIHSAYKFVPLASSNTSKTLGDSTTMDSITISFSTSEPGPHFSITRSDNSYASTCNIYQL